MISKSLSTTDFKNIVNLLKQQNFFDKILKEQTSGYKN